MPYRSQGDSHDTAVHPEIKGEPAAIPAPGSGSGVLASRPTGPSASFYPSDPPSGTWVLPECPFVPHAGGRAANIQLNTGQGIDTISATSYLVCEIRHEAHPGGSLTTIPSPASLSGATTGAGDRTRRELTNFVAMTRHAIQGE